MKFLKPGKYRRKEGVLWFSKVWARHNLRMMMLKLESLKWMCGNWNGRKGVKSWSWLRRDVGWIQRLFRTEQKKFSGRNKLCRDCLGELFWSSRESEFFWDETNLSLLTRSTISELPGDALLKHMHTPDSILPLQKPSYKMPTSHRYHHNQLLLILQKQFIYWQANLIEVNFPETL